MVKYLAGDKVKLIREGRYRVADPTNVQLALATRGGVTLTRGSLCILLCEKSWPPDGWWQVKWGKLDLYLHESDFELTNLLEIIARASAESWEL